jgi:hypothetical protein
MRDSGLGVFLRYALGCRNLFRVRWHYAGVEKDRTVVNLLGSSQASATDLQSPKLSTGFDPLGFRSQDTCRASGLLRAQDHHGQSQRGEGSNDYTLAHRYFLPRGGILMRTPSRI